MKRRILPLLLVLCLLWLTGCSFDDTSDEDLLQEIYGYYQSGKDKTDAPLTSFALPVLQGQTLDPITCPDGVQQTIGALLYEGLYALDTGFTPQPMLAESCTVSGTTCTITPARRRHVQRRLRRHGERRGALAAAGAELRALRRAPCRREPHRRGQRRHGCAHACL